MKKEEVKIYFYLVGGAKYYSPSLEFAAARAEFYGSKVYSESYLVDVIEAK